MDCCSSSSYMDYRHPSMNGNFCYPYSPSMLRSASPYPLAGSGMHGSSRYGSSGDYRAAALGYPSATAAYDGAYEKYYGAGGGGYHHPAASAYPSGYYGNYPSPAYREYGGYGGHYYHQSQSPYARAGGAPSAYGGGSYLAYPGSGRHYPSSSPLGHPFGRESYYHAPHNRDAGLHHQPQYSSFASYGSLPPYHRNGVGPGAPEHPSIGAKSQHQQQQQQQQQQQHQPYPVHQSFPGSHQEARGMVGESANGGTASLSADSPSSSSLFNAPNGYSPSPTTTDYALPTSYSGSGDSPPQHPLGAGTGGPAPDDGSGSEHRPASATPAPPSSQSAMLSATGEFSSGPKDTRMRKPKERKLQRAYGAGGAPGGGGGGGGGDGSEGASRTSSPNAGNGPSGNGPASTRIKSLDALTNLCWPEGEQFPTRMRKHSNANGSRTKDASNGRKENNEQDSPSSMASASPRGVVGSGRRTKKQSAGSKQSAKEAKAASEGKEKPTSNETIAPTPPVENKNVTPLPGFQQAFGSTEIGKFSEVFFNSSPSPADHSPAEHHPMHHHQEQHPHTEQQSHRTTQPVLGRHGTNLQQQQLLAMDALSAYESDVDTLSPQPWDPTRAGPRGPGDSYEGVGTGYNLQIGTSFHPAYYESSSYSDHAVDSPLGNYFSEMTCNEFVN